MALGPINMWTYKYVNTYKYLFNYISLETKEEGSPYRGLPTSYGMFHQSLFSRLFINPQIIFTVLSFGLQAVST